MPEPITWTSLLTSGESHKMASAEFLEQALSTNVDENAVSAIIGTLENQLVTSVPSETLQSKIVSIVPEQVNISSNTSSIIGVPKYNSECISEGEIEGVNFQSANNLSYSVVHSSQSSFVSPNFTQTISNANDQLKVIYSQTQALPTSTSRGTFAPQSLVTGCLSLSSQQNPTFHTIPPSSVQHSGGKTITMQPPLVIKQGSTPGQVGMQPGMVTVPMTVTSNMPPNVMSINKPGQNVVVTTQNIGSAQSTILPNVQILNMRPGAPTVAAQKSVATVSPRVVIGAQQVVGTRAAAPGITLQALQSLQQGQQGHLLLKTENGQYQLLRVGPAPAASNLAAPQPQTLRLSTVPAHPGVPTVSTSMAAPGQIPGQMPPGPVATPIAAAATSVQPGTPPPIPPTVTTQKPSDNTKEKCRNFLANLLDLSSKEPKSVERSVRNLIQELIDALVEPEEFCDRLERLLNASPQPCLIGFLKKSLPLLRQSLVTKELVIEGINPPFHHVTFSTIPTPTQQIMTGSNVQLQKPVTKPGSAIAVLQNIPVHSKINVNKLGKAMAVNSKSGYSRPTMQSSGLNTVLTPGKSLLRDKDKRMAVPFAPQPYVDDKMAGDDDINDVAAMGGVNLAEESQRILGSTEMIGTQIRSCKDEFIVPLHVMQAKIKAISQKHGLEESTPEVAALLCHAVQERLKNLVEKLAVIAQHRIDLMVKNDDRYEVTQDVKGQLKFLEERDRVVKKRREDSEREMLLRAAKSRSKNEDPEQAKLKAKAKEMQRAELEEVRQREANLTALQAIGPRKKPRLGEGPGPSDAGSSGNLQGGSGPSSRSQMALRSRIKRINFRDMLHLLEQEPDTRRSLRLYKAYLK